MTAAPAAGCSCRRVALIGPRGSGKSTVAAILARRLGWVRLETDHILTALAGFTIREMFDRFGEAEFRRREALIIRRVVTIEPAVIDAGGGAVLDATSRRLLHDCGLCVWLTGETDVLARRIRADAASAAARPSLTGREIGDEMRHVLRQRQRLYAETATLRIDTTQLDPAQVAGRILRRLGMTTTEPGP